MMMNGNCDVSAMANSGLIIDKNVDITLFISELSFIW